MARNKRYFIKKIVFIFFIVTRWMEQIDELGILRAVLTIGDCLIRSPGDAGHVDGLGRIGNDL